MMRPASSAWIARLALPWLAAAALSTLALGCGESFDPPSKLNSLRVLAVRADNPYPAPGDSVHMDMLWYDGKAPADTPRSVEVMWLGGCFNPPADLYYACFPQIAENLAAGQQDPASVAQWIGVGNSFDLTVPDDLISRRPTQEGRTPYGLSYVFFAVCAGHVMPAEPGEDGIPLGCFDDQGNRLGADDFVPGYTAFYTYDQITNSNPKVDGLLVDGNPIAEQDSPTFEPEQDVPVKVIVDPASVERNPLSLDPDGNPLWEMMWVDYYASDGKLDKSARLVNDATTGFNDDNGVTLKMPPASGATLRLFAVVHDSRGGVQWVERTLRTK